MVRLWESGLTPEFHQSNPIPKGAISRRKQPMLIKINNTIINVANVVSAHFTPATDKLKGALTIVCVNNVEPTNSL
jgi:pyruvate/2-oxoacid:ferredoxin oxidoreductase beta subunit